MHINAKSIEEAVDAHSAEGEFRAGKCVKLCARVGIGWACFGPDRFIVGGGAKARMLCQIN